MSTPDKATFDKLVALLIAKEAKAQRLTREQRRIRHEKQYGYPKPPLPRTPWGWALKLYNWFLRCMGWKEGVAQDYWRDRAFNFLELERQVRCSHLKGQVGYRSAYPMRFDYNVSQHTFIDGSTQIKCNVCRWEVWNKPEFSLKWKEGLRMVDLSTNRASSAERILKPTPNRTPANGYFWSKTVENDKNPIIGLNVTDEDYKAAKAREAAEKGTK